MENNKILNKEETLIFLMTNKKKIIANIENAIINGEAKIFRNEPLYISTEEGFFDIMFNSYNMVKIVTIFRLEGLKYDGNIDFFGGDEYFGEPWFLNSKLYEKLNKMIDEKEKVDNANK